MKTIINLFVSILLFTGFTSVQAQETHSATKKDEKVFPFNHKTSQLIIHAERGQINIQAWERDEVSVSLILIAKNINQTVALKELGYVKYNLEKSRDNVFLNNNIILPDSKKELGSIISARYDIRVPRGSYILVSNKFGRVSLNEVSGILNCDMQYCDMTISGFRGTVNIRHSVGDINITRSEIKGTFNTKHVNLSLQEIAGKIYLNSDFGKLVTVPGTGALELSLTSHATEVVYENRKLVPVDISIDGSYCPLTIERTSFLKGKIVSTYDSAAEQEAWTLKYTPAEKSSILKIKAAFGSISLM